MNLIKSHKVVAATLLIGVIGSAVGITVISQPVDNQPAQVDKMAVKPEQPEAQVIQPEDKQEVVVESLPEPVAESVQPTEPAEELVQKDSFWLVANDELIRIGYDAHRREAHLLAGYMTRNLGDEPLPKALIEQRARECAELSNSFGFTPREQAMAQMKLTLEPCWAS